MDKLSFNIFPNVNFIDLCMYQFGHEQCEPGHSFGPATRNHYLFHYVLSGTGTLMADNAKGITQTYNIKSGQGFLIFPGQINTYIADDKLPWEYIWIEFDGLRVKEALTTTELTKNNPVYHTHSKDIREKLVEEIALHHKAPLRITVSPDWAYVPFSGLSDAVSQIIKTRSGWEMSDFYIKEAMNYIEQNFQNDISIEDIAGVCGINRSYLGKNFSKNSVWDIHPQEFLMNYRMIKATELLKLTSLSIADVGSAVGYENQLHFSRAFKNIYGVAPREWRNEHK